MSELKKLRGVSKSFCELNFTSSDECVSVCVCVCVCACERENERGRAIKRERELGIEIRDGEAVIVTKSRYEICNL